MSKEISDLHPDLQILCEEFLEDCKLKNIDVRIIFTYRSPEEQDKLYAQGRTAPGKVVTNLKGGASKHNFTIDDKPAAKAFDFGVFEDGKYIADGRNDLYTEAGEIGEFLGLTWGGRWKRPFDPSHLQID